MKRLSKADAKKILKALEQNKKKKWVPLDTMSSWTGIYPDDLGEMLSEFDPMAQLDPSFDVRDVEEALKEYLNSDAPVVKENRTVVRKKNLLEYEGVSDFIYKKMTSAGGLFDKNAVLSDLDLSILRKLVNEEIKARKPKKAKRKKK